MKIIKDRHARSENKVNVAVPETRYTQEDMRGKQNKGITAEEARGEPADEKMGATGGVPSFMPGPADDVQVLTAPHCSAQTLKGEACKAYPITGTATCIGHARQIESN
jgi:hypothetical protein